MSEEKKIKKGHFGILCEFLTAFDGWLQSELDEVIDTDKLVMTFSNVNPDVVQLNAESIGIDNSPQFKAIKLGRLHDLVGQRNSIGHGAVIEPPSSENFSTLLAFTENLVTDYCELFIKWMPTLVRGEKFEITTA
jgi:hypothetical protein